MDFYVYRLNYASKQGFLDAMIDRGVLIDDNGSLIKGRNTISIVPVFNDNLPKDRYHVDIKVKEPLNFSKTVCPTIKTPVHGVIWAKGAKNL